MERSDRKREKPPYGELNKEQQKALGELGHDGNVQKKKLEDKSGTRFESGEQAMMRFARALKDEATLTPMLTRRT